MARKRTFVIHTTEDGKPYLFYTVASSSTEATRIFRKIHGRRRVKLIEDSIPAEQVPVAPPQPRPVKKTRIHRRKKGS